MSCFCPLSRREWREQRGRIQLVICVDKWDLLCRSAVSDGADEGDALSASSCVRVGEAAAATAATVGKVFGNDWRMINDERKDMITRLCQEMTSFPNELLRFFCRACIACVL